MRFAFSLPKTFHSNKMNIKPASNSQLKSWKKLQMGKYRKKEGLFLAEGIRCVEQILANGQVEVLELIIEKGWEPNQITAQINQPVYELEASDFESVSDTDNPQGVVAVCKTPNETTVQTLSQKKGIILAVDAIQDPGNLGTIIRTAAWFGVTGILVGTGTVDPFHPKVVRSTAGSTGVLPHMSGNLADLLESFERENWQTHLLDAGKHAKDLKDTSPSTKSILVVGNEGNGIDPKLFNNSRSVIRIEGEKSRVESLNVAIAASIVLYYFS